MRFGMPQRGAGTAPRFMGAHGWPWNIFTSISYNQDVDLYASVHRQQSGVRSYKGAPHYLPAAIGSPKATFSIEYV